MKIVLPTLHVRRSAQSVPLAAGCLAAALPAEQRRETVLIDLFLDQGMQHWRAEILAREPDLVCFPVYVWNRVGVIALATLLKESRPELMLIAGGPEASGDPEGLLASGAWDAVIVGEGEEIFAALVSRLPTAARLTAGPGLRVPTGSQPGAAAQLSAPLPDLASLPSPWLSDVLRPTPEGGVLWEVARGCAFSCDYCVETRRHGEVRTYPFARLAAELEWFVRAGVRQVWVLDATFNYPPERGIELLELLLATAPQLHYHLEAKADFIDRHTATLLGKLSCSVQLGLQSASEEVLRTIHRPLDLDSLTEKVHLLQAEGVVYGFDLIYGLPGDNYAGFRHSLDVTMAFHPNHVHVFPLALLPGSRLDEQRQRHGLVADPNPPYEVIRSPSWSEDDLEACRRLAAVVDIFFNTGRAVACLPALLEVFGTSPSDFFSDLLAWALEQPDLSRDQLLDPEGWEALDAYRLQQNYLVAALKRSGKAHLVSAVLDLLCYHYHYAETLLGEELLPLEEEVSDGARLWEVPLYRVPQLRLVPFSYEILDLLEIEEMALEDFVNLFRPVGSTALFLRRGNEVYCESLDEDLLRLLRQSDGQRTPAEIFAGCLPEVTGLELVAFAVGEGMLRPAAPATAG